MTHAIAPILGSIAAGAQSGGSARDLVPLFMWIGLVVALLVAAGLMIGALRRELFQDPQDPNPGGATLLQDLRSMRDRGEISEEEFRSIRATMVERAKASMDPNAMPSSGASAGASSRVADGKSGGPRDPRGF